MDTRYPTAYTLMCHFTKKIILAIPAIVFIFSFVSPYVADAALSPLTDTQCWTEAMCLGRTHDCKYCFKEGEGQCSAPFGKCYHPHEPIDLQIHLGSTGQVTDMAEYISLAYRYVLSIGSILAVVVIIASGIIYLTAGGNPSRIGQAKEYIGGAVVGVILLFTSYLILNTLNPDLVRLKMPNISMIRPADMPATFCADIRWDTGNTENNRPLFFRADDVAHDGDSPTDPRRLKDYAEATSSGGRNYDPEQLTCNFAFYSPTIAGQTPCYGSGGCDPRDGHQTACVRDVSKANWFICQTSNLNGSITTTTSSYPFDQRILFSFIHLKMVCNNNHDYAANLQTVGEIGLAGISEINGYNIAIPSIDNLRENGCQNDGGVKGFFAHIALQEQDRFFNDNYHFNFGKSGCVNSGGSPYSITNRISVDYSMREGVARTPNIIPDEELWSLDELSSESGVRCDLVIENHPNSFPISEYGGE